MLPSTVLHDYYAILGIPQSADPASIKSAYKRLALVKHPDRRRNEPKATAEFQLVSLAPSFSSLLEACVVTDAVILSSTLRMSSSEMSIDVENMTEYMNQQYVTKK